MPVQKPTSITTSEFKKNIQELEKNLMKQMNLANLYYNEIYRKYQNKPNIKEFSICRKKFNQIKSIIESEKISSPSIDKLYFEAWISTLYSNKHALNLEPETEEQLNILNQKIQEIGQELQQLLIKKSSLDLSDNSSRLLKYINNFEHSWKTDEKRLLADATFNFAESLVEQSSFQQALYQFEQAINLYEKAAHATDSIDDYNKQLLEFSKQTKERLEEIKNQKDFPNILPKELSIRLQRIPDFPSKWKIVNQPSITQSVEEKPAVEIESFTEKTDLPEKLKRKSNEESTYPETKKLKKVSQNPNYKELLDKFNDLNININLAELTNSNKSHDERRAIAHNNYSIFLIEDLNNKQNNYTNSKQVELLKKTENLLRSSAEFYEKTNLSKEKEVIEKLLDMLKRSRDTLKTKTNQPPQSKASSSINTEKYQTEPVTVLSEKKYREYQHTYSTRYVQNFFRENSSEQNLNIHQNLKIVSP